MRPFVGSGVRTAAFKDEWSAQRTLQASNDCALADKGPPA